MGRIFLESFFKFLIAFMRNTIPHNIPVGMFIMLVTAFMKAIRNLKKFSKKILVLLNDSSFTCSKTGNIFVFVFICFFLLLDLFTFSLGIWETESNELLTVFSDPIALVIGLAIGVELIGMLP